MDAFHDGAAKQGVHWLSHDGQQQGAAQVGRVGNEWIDRAFGLGSWAAEVHACRGFLRRCFTASFRRLFESGADSGAPPWLS